MRIWNYLISITALCLGATHAHDTCRSKTQDLIALCKQNDSFAISSFIDQHHVAIDFSMQDAEGNTALHYATQHHNTSVVRRLLDANADPDCRDSFDAHAATRLNQENECTEPILCWLDRYRAGYDICAMITDALQACDDSDSARVTTLLDCACAELAKLPRGSITPLLNKFKNSQGMSLLHAAVITSRYELAQLLVTKHGMRVDTTDMQDRNALMLAIEIMPELESDHALPDDTLLQCIRFFCQQDTQLAGSGYVYAIHLGKPNIASYIFTTIGCDLTATCFNDGFDLLDAYISQANETAAKQLLPLLMPQEKRLERQIKHSIDCGLPFYLQQHTLWPDNHYCIPKQTALDFIEAMNPTHAPHKESLTKILGKFPRRSIQETTKEIALAVAESRNYAKFACVIEAIIAMELQESQVKQRLSNHLLEAIIESLNAQTLHIMLDLWAGEIFLRHHFRKPWQLAYDVIKKCHQDSAAGNASESIADHESFVLFWSMFITQKALHVQNYTGRQSYYDRAPVLIDHENPRQEIECYKKCLTFAANKHDQKLFSVLLLAAQKPLDCLHKMLELCKRLTSKKIQNSSHSIAEKNIFELYALRDIVRECKKCYICARKNSEITQDEWLHEALALALSRNSLQEKDFYSTLISQYSGNLCPWEELLAIAGGYDKLTEQQRRWFNKIARKATRKRLCVSDGALTTKSSRQPSPTIPTAESMI